MYEYSCKVERVVDGDTVDVVLNLGFDIMYKSRVRLYGVIWMRRLEERWLGLS